MTLGRLLRIARHRIRSLVRPGAIDHEVARELAFHFDRLVDEHTRDGLPLDAARRAARLALGNAAALQEECRDARGLALVQGLGQVTRPPTLEGANAHA